MEACGLAVALLVALLWPRTAGLPLLLVGIVFWSLSAGTSAADPELALLDVGQGEAILLRDGGQALLVDGGGWQRSDIGGRILLPVLSSFGVRRLRAIVLTHPDLDHCGGLVDIAAYLRVEEVWTAPGWRDSPCAREVLTLPGIGHRFLWAGERASMGRWKLRALHPSPGDRRGSNNRSLVLAATVHGRRVLLTGDLEAVGEGRILSRASSSEVACDILKIAHHGSRTSTTVAWLEAAGPRLALLSAGLRNRYGHPASVVLERLE
jgi:competence protein ComEC